VSVRLRDEGADLSTLRTFPIDLVRRRSNRSELSRGPVADVLRSDGFDVDRVAQADLELRPGRVLWMSGNPGWYKGTFQRLAKLPASNRPFVVVWHYEPLPMPAAAGIRMERLHTRELAKIVLRDARITDPYSNARYLTRLSSAGLIDLLVVTSSSAHEFLAGREIASSVVPLGSNPRDGKDLGLARDIDVLLLATLDVPRRKRVIRHLRGRGISLVALGDWKNPAYFGDQRTELLNRTKILLNIPRHEGLLSGRTMIIGMMNRALVVADPIYRSEPYRPGEHYVSAKIADMPDAIARYLQDENARATITTAAHGFVTNELTMERSVHSILGLVEERLRSRDGA
jgi:hypothetical protein